MLRLSVLDQSAAISGQPHAHSIRRTVALAEHCERLGYHRFWLSEHHNHEGVTGTAPEVLLAAIAMRTHAIRIGSAGIMLPHYSALKVAECFRVLDALAPGRIDLGLGRAPGSDGRTAYALNPNAGAAAEQFPQQVRDLACWVAGRPLPEGHPFRAVRAFPEGETAPEIWILGSSDYGAQVAAYFGVPYCFAHFFTDGRGCEQAIALYREHYRPSEAHPEPHAAVCVWALAADSEAEAQHLFTSRLYSRLLRDRGIRLPIVPADAPCPVPLGPADDARANELRRSSFVGTGGQVAQQVGALAGSLGLAEVAVVTATYETEAQRRSYQLLAEAFGLEGRAPQVSATQSGVPADR